MRRRPTLLRRLIVSQIAAMAIAWLLLTAWLLVQMMAFGNGDLDRRMDLLAQALAEAGSAARGDPVELRRRLAVTEHIFVDGVIATLESARPYLPIYRMWAADGRLACASNGAAAVAFDAPPGGLSQLRIAGQDYRLATATASDGSVRVAVAERLDQRLSANWPFLQVIGASQLVILVWIIGVTAVAARRGFGPLRELANTIAARPLGDLSPLGVDALYAETAPIVDEINGLLRRESDRLRSERGFLADAAHELRTPLAAIGVQAHLLVHTADDCTREATRGELQQAIDRVSHLLSQLLTIARLDAAPAPLPMQALEIVEPCRQRLAALALLARPREVALQLDAPEALYASVDRAGLASVVDNLVANAIRHAPVGGRVEVGLFETERGVCLGVRDDGPGIAPIDRERVFERFVRLPGAAGQGSGLGLAIVRSVVRSQSATIDYAEGLSGRGVGFVVTFARA